MSKDIKLYGDITYHVRLDIHNLQRNLACYAGLIIVLAGCIIAVAMGVLK
jgi:hypothetical protein